MISRRNRLWTLLRALLRGPAAESGQSMVETAACLLVALTVCFWVVEMSMLAYTVSVLNEAAQEGVHYAIVHGIDSNNCSGPTTGCADTSAANVVSVVRTAAQVSLHNMTGLAVAVSYPEATGCHAGSLVSIVLTDTYVPYVKLPGIAKSIKLTAQGRIVY